ncbi:hypothetical protein [Actinoplanes xinjiangensis]|uniref:hypothetical protein n=1 Tax=Actinoplanes xinjiangensis TaxID=512350 RepID=UPI003439848C
MAELEFGLQEVALEPVDGLVRQHAGLDVHGGRAGDDRAGRQDGLVVAEYLLVAALGVDIAVMEILDNAVIGRLVERLLEQRRVWLPRFTASSQ